MTKLTKQQMNTLVKHTSTVKILLPTHTMMDLDRKQQVKYKHKLIFTYKNMMRNSKCIFHLEKKKTELNRFEIKNKFSCFKNEPTPLQVFDSQSAKIKHYVASIKNIESYFSMLNCTSTQSLIVDKHMALFENIQRTINC